MSSMRHLRLDPSKRKPLLKDQTDLSKAPGTLQANKVHTHPRGSSGQEDGSVFFIGTATTLIEWKGIRILTDPNFLHAGDHVHLGPGVTAQRKTDPAVDLHQLPPLDCILLSHYHEDHFDRLVEKSLNKAFDIITTPHAKECLTSAEAKDEPFRSVHDLEFFESLMLHVDGGSADRNADSRGKVPVVKVTGMPGKHVPPRPLARANDFLKAVPPTNGWLVELGYASKAPTGGDPDSLDVGYRIYISGDTLFVDELKEIPRRLRDDRIDLMLIHLGGTTIPGPSLPLLMVTMDAEQGLKLMQLMDPDLTIPIHFDDYDVFKSPLSDFQRKVEEEGWKEKVVYLDCGEQYRFQVKGP